MSAHAMFWAFERADTRNSQCKLTLVALANFANESHESYPALSTIVRLSKLNIKTVRQALDDLLADGFIADTGQRKGQQRNVRVFRLAVATLPDAGGLPIGEAEKTREINQSTCEDASTLPDLAGLDSDRSGFGRATLPDSGGEPLLEPLTPETPNGVSAPKGADTWSSDLKAKNGRISPVWEPPLQSELSEDVAAVVAYWPDGAYAAQAAAFRDYWLGESGPRAVKADWKRSWFTWIRRAGRRVPAPPPPVRSNDQGEGGEGAAVPERPAVRERGEEREAEYSLRAALEAEFGSAEWLRRSGLKSGRLDEEGKVIGLTVFAPHDRRDVVTTLQRRIRRSVGERTGLEVRWVAAVEGKRESA